MRAYIDEGADMISDIGTVSYLGRDASTGECEGRDETVYAFYYSTSNAMAIHK